MLEMFYVFTKPEVLSDIKLADLFVLCRQLLSWLTICFSSCSREIETPTAAKKQERARKGLFLLIDAFIIQFTGEKA